MLRLRNRRRPVTVSRTSLALLFSVGFAGSAASGSAQEVNFAGKTVRMILGQASGGGADTSARLIAAFLGKYLPSNPTILVVNMPGANGILANNHLVHQVAADGTTFIAGPGSQTIGPPEKNSAARYAPAAFEFIGSAQNS